MTTETLEELEHKYFILEMQDTWDSSDYRYADELKEKIRNLKGEICMIQRYQELLNDCIDLQESIMFRQMQKKLENLRKEEMVWNT